MQENQLLSRYKHYLKGLENMLDLAGIKKYSKLELRIAKVALSCFCELLQKKPVFNFSDKIMELIVPYMAHKQEELRTIAVEYVGNMFIEDDNGQFSLRVSNAPDFRTQASTKIK